MSQSHLDRWVVGNRSAVAPHLVVEDRHGEGLTTARSRVKYTLVRADGVVRKDATLAYNVAPRVRKGIV